MTTTTHLDADEVQRFDLAELPRGSKIQRLGSGAIRVLAMISRTGIFEYQNPDGSIRRELRTPEDTFDEASLATLKGVPVVDHTDHSDMLTTSTTKAAAIGHVEAPRRSADMVAADLVVHHGPVIAAIERGERSDVSAGYHCTLDRTPGTWQGEHYDGVQRNVKYNHVAVLPHGKGRAGTAVGLRLDSKEQPMSMSPEETTKFINQTATQRYEELRAEQDLGPPVDAGPAQLEMHAGLRRQFTHAKFRGTLETDVAYQTRVDAAEAVEARTLQDAEERRTLADVIRLDRDSADERPEAELRPAQAYDGRGPLSESKDRR
jgi:hypothetical protein